MNDKDNNELADKLYRYKQKWDYFWDYYKIHFFVGLGLIIFTVFLVVQCSGKVDPDVNIVYVGTQLISNIDDSILEEGEIVLSHTEITNELTSILDKDLNGDGKTSVKFITFRYSPDIPNMTDVKKLLDIEIMSGDSVIYFMDRKVYDELKSYGMFVTFPYAIGYTPEKAIDMYHIKLRDLPVYGDFPTLDLLPDDTVVAIRGAQTANVSQSYNEQNERHYRNHEYLKKLVEYKPKD